MPNSGGHISPQPAYNARPVSSAGTRGRTSSFVLSHWKQSGDVPTTPFRPVTACQYVTRDVPTNPLERRPPWGGSRRRMATRGSGGRRRGDYDARERMDTGGLTVLPTEPIRPPETALAANLDRALANTTHGGSPQPRKADLTIFDRRPPFPTRSGWWRPPERPRPFLFDRDEKQRGRDNRRACHFPAGGTYARSSSM